jgi:hypothetical protein
MKTKYRVSIAVRIPGIYEIELYAENIADARSLAYEAWLNGDGKLDAEGFDDTALELNLDEDSFKAGNTTAGLYVELAGTKTCFLCGKDVIPDERGYCVECDEPITD